MAEVMAESGYNEEDIFDCGICGEIVFLVVVPLIGACRVPVDALSHFMAGADEYTAEGMPEHWHGEPSGMWTIKRDRLRILQKSWEVFSVECEHRARAYDALFSPVPEQADTQPQAGNDAPVVELPETKEQRQDRRLKACIDAGLRMNDKAALTRLPDGVGNVADSEGVTRQAFSTDVKAALKRREAITKPGRVVRYT